MSVKSQSSPVDGGVLASATVISSLPRSRTTISAVLRWAGITVNGLALIDSGPRAVSLMRDGRWNKGSPCWTSTTLPPSLRLMAGHFYRSSHHLSGEPYRLRKSQRDYIFFVFQSPYTPIVLGHPWLTQHNPQIDWVKGSIHSWNLSCHVNCLVSAVPAVSSVSVFQEEPGDLFGVPEEYHDLRAVFSRSRATSLPPHRPYDCSIELLPGTMPPRGRLYSLSAPGGLWRTTLQSPLPLALLFLPPLLPVRGFSLWKRRMGLCVPVLIIGGWTT